MTARTNNFKPMSNVQYPPAASIYTSEHHSFLIFFHAECTILLKIFWSQHLPFLGFEKMVDEFTIDNWIDFKRFKVAGEVKRKKPLTGFWPKNKNVFLSELDDSEDELDQLGH